MIISKRWLRDLLKLELEAEQIADRLTNAGLEVDALKRLAGQIDQLIIGQVEKVEKHPDADRLSLTRVNIGTEVLQIVCGAANVREGLMVAVAQAGAKLPNGMKIKRAKMRGVESNGMLCSAAELGLEEQSEGILELDADAQIGARADEYLQLDDVLLDIDLTPNRGDCLSVLGVARELKVLAGAKLRTMDIPAVALNSKAAIKVTIEDQQACPCYLGRVIEQINCAAASPLWLQERLRRAGVRPISAVVDITNYVMLELGQPMHAFDRAQLDEQIIVRHARDGEQITLLDDNQATLNAQTLVIADKNKAIAIAGVMGGLHSAIGQDSQDIVLEAAHFTRKAVAGTARHYGLHTESSHRFERGVDPSLPALAIERASQLVLDICGGRAGPVTGIQSESGQLQPVSLRFDRLQRLLGLSLEFDEVENILLRIADKVEPTNSGWRVIPPSYRFDLEVEADLIEEVARVKGYDNIPTAIPRIAPRSVTATESRLEQRRLRHALVAQGFNEIISYSFIGKEENAVFSDEPPLALLNPLAENMSVMRTTLLPGLVNAAKYNVNRQRERLRLFEIGATYHHGDQHSVSEVQRLAVLASGPQQTQHWSVGQSQAVDFFDLKGLFESLIGLTGKAQAYIFDPSQRSALHPGQCSAIQLAGQTIGYLGRLHPSIEARIGFAHAVYVLEVEYQFTFAATLPVFKPVSRFPGVRRDLSIIVDEQVAAADIIKSVRQVKPEWLENVEIFDIYRGQGIKARHKSVSLSVYLRLPNRTMTDDEADAAMDTILTALNSGLGAELRAS